MGSLNRIIKERPDLAGDQAVISATKDADEYAALAAFASSEAGSLIIKRAMQELADRVDNIASTYSRWSHPELIALCAALSAHLSFIKDLTRAKSNLDVVTEALKEMITPS